MTVPLWILAIGAIGVGVDRAPEAVDGGENVWERGWHHFLGGR